MNMEFRSDDVLPEHPGPLMKSWFMDKKGLSVDDVSFKSGLTVTHIQNIIEGKESIDRETAIALTPVFHSSAETLYRLQDEYDHYVRVGKIKNFDSLPRLNPDVRLG